MGFRFCNILFFLFFACQAQAAEPGSPLDFKGIYVFEFSGIPIGQMGIEAEQNGAAYAVAADIKTTGLLKLFVKHESHTTVDGSGGSRVYETNYRTRKKQKYVKMAAKNGALVEETLNPPDNRATRPAVPAHLKNAAYDPLSFILAMREHVMAAKNEGREHFSLDVYDGRRLTRAGFTPLGEKKIRMNGKKYFTFAVSVTRELVSGFTKSELEDREPNEPPAIVYFSNDTRFVPLKLEASAWGAPVSATLAKECRTGESCLLGIR